MDDFGAIARELKAKNVRTIRDVKELSMTPEERDAKVAELLAVKKAKEESQARAAAQLRAHLREAQQLGREPRVPIGPLCTQAISLTHGTGATAYFAPGKMRRPSIDRAE